MTTNPVLQQIYLENLNNLASSQNQNFAPLTLNRINFLKGIYNQKGGSDYIKQNSKSYRNPCTKYRFQSYGPVGFGTVQTYNVVNQCKLATGCQLNNLNYQQYVINQQNLYALMRRKPELFPIISWVKNMNLTPGEQRAYSNLWYRQFGTSQARPANDNWGGFYLPGSEVPYTN